MQELFQSSFPESGGWLEVTHPKAVKFLKDPERRGVLAPFMQQPRSLGDLAQQRGLSLSKLHYTVQQLLDWGLLNVVRVEKRKGRPVKFYAAASAFFIPYKDLLTETSQDLFIETELAAMTKLAAAAEHSFRQLIQSDLCSDEWGRLYQLDRQGDFDWFTNSRRLRFQTFEDYNRYIMSEEAPPYLREYCDFSLSSADAKAFQRELICLRRRYHAKSHGRVGAVPEETKRYRFRVYFVEALEE